ncbi:MAG: HEAT repeat domain-containing protein [Dehalococcoidia bacterium]|nr:HEAT repeat domain-containing protein [Dehalococcoidia bacterium]
MFTSDSQSTRPGPARDDNRQENHVQELIAALGREDVTDSLVELGILAVAPLVQALKHEKDGLVKYNAALALSKIGQPAVDPLLESVDYDDADVRLEAVWALGQIGDDRAVEPLVEALKDEDWYVRKQAAVSLCTLKKPESVGLLVEALGDEDWHVRKQAARILGTVGDARAAKPLARTLRDEDPVVQQEAAAALGKIGDPGAVADAILASLKHEDPFVRNEAVATLQDRGEEAVPALIHCLIHRRDENVKREAADALVIVGSPAVEALCHVLTINHKKSHILARQIAAWTLGTIGDERAVEPLGRTLANDPNPAVRHEAARALARLDGERAVELLIDATKDRDEDVRREAKRALRTMRTRDIDQGLGST